MSSRVRVLHVLPWVHSGGVERLRLTLAQRLDPARFEQRVVTMSASPGYVERFASCGVDIVTTGQTGWATGDVEGMARVAAVIAEWSPHIVHGAVFEGASMAVRAGRLSGVPVVVTEETSHPTNRSWRGHLLYRGITRLADHSIAVSPWVGSYLVRQLRVPANQVSVIANGVDERSPTTPEQRAAARSRLGIPPDAFVVGTVCRLDDFHKRVTDLVDAFAELCTRTPSSRLLIVGAGRDMGLVERHVQRAGVVDRVLFTGRLEDPEIAYDSMDVFALLSRHEAFGLVLVEAMFAGLPVVATAVGGMVDVVDNGVTGHLVEPFRPELAAERLLQLAADEPMRRVMGAAGHVRAQRHYGSQRYVAEIAALYETLLRRRGVVISTPSAETRTVRPAEPHDA